MYRLILILFVILILFPVQKIHAENNVYGSIEVGTILNDDRMYAEILIGYTIGKKIVFDIYTGIDTVMATENILKYNPIESAYIIGSRLEVKGIYFQIEHTCFHPVWSDNELFRKSYYLDEGTLIGVGYYFGKGNKW